MSDQTEVQEKEDQRQNRRKSEKKGLVMVNTGDGKGKTTAAIGVIFRAWGRGMKVCMIQFLKHEGGNWGEVKAAQQLGIDWIKTGDGFTWTSKDMDETIAKALHGWEIAKEKIASGTYDLVVLDEFTYPMTFGWIDTKEVLDWLEANKPPMLHLIITGRNAPPELVAYADLVSEITKVKHPFDVGIQAQAGIEF
jgi:cob(I)alamin adenosyltransferase